MNATGKLPSFEAARRTKVLALLAKAYPKAHVALNFHTPWELLVAVILAAQCTDVMVNRVTEMLFAKYKTLDDYIGANLAVFEADIRRTGFYRNKAKNIRATARLIKEKFGGQVPKTMEDLLTLPGVARKTANVVLGNAYGVVVGIPVDTHMIRLSQRLRLVNMDLIGGGKQTRTFAKQGKTIVDFKKDADPVKIERELMSWMPRADWLRATYTIIDHGRAICKAPKPKCAECVLSDLCPASRI